MINRKKTKILVVWNVRNGHLTIIVMCLVDCLVTDEQLLYFGHLNMKMLIKLNTCQFVVKLGLILAEQCRWTYVRV